MSWDKYYGKKIVKAGIVDGTDTERLRLDFEDGTAIVIYDDGQSCCEHRHMSTDDNPMELVGAVLTGISETYGDCKSFDDGEHEICFVNIKTNLGGIQLANHNEHNGYYGGFIITVSEI